MSEPLLPTRFLFRFSTACAYHSKLGEGTPGELPAQCRLPSLGELDGQTSFADVRAAWSEAGLAMSVRVGGKRHPSWCRESKPEDSDGLQLWIDTRDTHNIHRATRFCHRFLFLPFGGGRDFSQSVSDQLLVDRARENANPVRPGLLKSATEKRVDGYVLSVFIPTAALTGFNPIDHPRLGFTYSVFDRELGQQYFSVGSEFPFASDPSLWGSLELVR
ncbi:MAG TPA: hypothetical protein VHV08_10585 [Pirellulales bacterium]|jgi:hypothetical protein|nr:hypothetical protein [Pirellulales bacterium]